VYQHGVGIEMRERTQEVSVVPNTAVVVGLGNIGGVIAARIAQAGEPVIGVELDAERRRRWHVERVAVGVRTAASLAEVPWAEVARVLVVVRMTDQALAVIGEIAANARTPLACHVIGRAEAGEQLDELYRAAMGVSG
jgi:prephenate dehydrogenase